jgi:hypothetical protein
VSFDASLQTGFDSYFNGSLSYFGGGTSAACPCWAGLIAIANQGRVAAGGTELDSSTNPQQTLEALYSLPASDFHDITTGYNGFNAGPGYDFVTGRGTPIANTLIPDLVSYGKTPTVTGISPSTGLPAGGANVTITGTNLIGATAVMFGSVAATSFTVLSSTKIVAVAPAEAAGSVDVTVTTPGGTTALTAADKFNYGVPPSIATQPGNQTVKAGSGTSFTAAANGNPTPSVQWYVSTNGGTSFTPLSNGGVYSGVTTDTLTITGATKTMNGYEYKAVFTNSVGTATTSAAKLTVDFAPSVTTQPGNKSVKPGKSTSFTAAASGNPAPSVQWYVSTNGGATFTPLSNGGTYSGVTTDTLTITGAKKSMNGYKYKAVFTNSDGTATTDDATLTV